MTIPKGNHVLILPDDPEIQTEGGIIRAASKKANTGTVLSISEDADNPGFTVTDRVLFNRTRALEYEDGTICVSLEMIEGVVPKGLKVDYKSK